MAKVMILAGTEKGAFLLTSDARRKSWKIEGPLLSGWKVFDVVLDQRSTPALFAATGSYVYGPTINISEDMGKSWKQVTRGPSYEADAGRELKAIWTVIPGPDNQPKVLYAGVSEAGLFVSRDGGLQWEELSGVSRHETSEEWVGGLGGLCCHSILTDPLNPKRMWVGISAVGVLSSEDAGKTWAVKNSGLPIVIETKKHKEIGSCVHSLVADPHNPNRIYQQNHRGVFRTRDGGENWERIENGLPTNFGFPIVVDQNRPDHAYIVSLKSDEYRFPKDGELTVYRTHDGGDSWEGVRNGLPSNCYSGVLRQAMATDGLDKLGIYFGTSGGQIFYSRDGGEAWDTMPCILPRINSIRAAIV